MGRTGIRILALACACSLGLLPPLCVQAGQPQEEKEDLERLIELYNEYENRFAAIETVQDIEGNGFHVIENQSFPVILESFGEEEVFFLPVMEEE